MRAPRRSRPAAQQRLPPAAAKGREKVSPYDFRRPERVGKEQMRALQTLHEGFGRNFGAALSALLRCIVEVKLTSVDQLTYSEFVFSLENPTCFNLLKADPLEGSLILDINPSVLYPIIDRLLGGGRETGILTRRPLTEIELRLVSRITTLFLEEMRRAWENVLPLDAAGDSRREQPAAGADRSAQRSGRADQLRDHDWRRSRHDEPVHSVQCHRTHQQQALGEQLGDLRPAQFSPQNVQQIGHNLHGSLVEMVVMLAETRITTHDLLALRVGDIITTEKDVHQPLMVFVEGVNKFRAGAGSHKGHKAIRIEPASGSANRPSHAQVREAHCS